MLWLRVFHNRAITAPAGAAGIAELSWRRIRPQAHVADRIQFLTGVWSEGLSSSLAIGQRTRSVPCHVDLPMWQLPMWQLASSERKGGGRRKGVRGGEEGEGQKEEKEEGEGERKRGHLD